MNELSEEQIAFFKENGYLILKGMMDPELCRQARERMWASMPVDSPIKRDDPTTHVGPIPPEFESEDSLHIRKGYLWQLRECGTEHLLVDLVCNARIWRVAEQMLGAGELREPVVGGEPMGARGAAWPGGPTDPATTEGIRGIYNTLPFGDKPREPDAGHTDGHPFNLGFVGLIADTPPDGGAFKVWPGSHKRLYRTFQMPYDQPRIPFYEHLPSHKGIIHSDAYLQELDNIMKDTRPVDCHGEEGDIVLWHHRLVHMAGHNHSEVIRQAVLYDFNRQDLDTCRLGKLPEDMWRDWSAELRDAAEGYSVEFAQTQRLPNALTV